MELATQVSALLGTSLVIYWATSPNHEKELEVMMDSQQLTGKLTGVKRYSSYHRKRMLDIQQRIITTSSLSSSSSSAMDSNSTTSTLSDDMDGLSER
mmetsp:Transcript_19274/g.53604  ORF Transcript_19274/g.53604 Transcript_19274/m.53604 type:complete len:97 (+) Transcript_19274:1055-1345(+)